MSHPNLLPNIDEFLEEVDDNLPVELKNLDELIYKIRADTGLDLEAIKIIVRSFFQEMRNQVLKGCVVHIRALGKMFIAGPKTGTKKRIFVKFKPPKLLVRNINRDRDS